MATRIDKEALDRLRDQMAQPVLPDEIQQARAALMRCLWRLWRIQGELAALGAEPGGDRVEVERVCRLLYEAYQLANRGVPYEVCSCRSQNKEPPCPRCDGMGWLSVGQHLKAFLSDFGLPSVDFLPSNLPSVR